MSSAKWRPFCLGLNVLMLIVCKFRSERHIQINLKPGILKNVHRFIYNILNAFSWMKFIEFQLQFPFTEFSIVILLCITKGVLHDKSTLCKVMLVAAIQCHQTTMIYFFSNIIQSTIVICYFHIKIIFFKWLYNMKILFIWPQIHLYLMTYIFIDMHN